MIFLLVIKKFRYTRRPENYKNCEASKYIWKFWAEEISKIRKSFKISVAQDIFKILSDFNQQIPKKSHWNYLANFLSQKFDFLVKISILLSVIIEFRSSRRPQESFEEIVNLVDNYDVKIHYKVPRKFWAFENEV